MLVPGRHSSSAAYRYGFQGQEKDDEIKGEGNSLNYTFRMHDPRVGRFFARDPMEKDYPFYSPYHFSSNQPIHAHELEGKESFNDLSFNTDPALAKFRSSMTNEERKNSSDAFNKGFLATTFAGGAVVSTGLLVLPELSAAYSSYSTWFGTTQLSSSVSALTWTGVRSGLINTSLSTGLASGGSNLLGQFATNGFKLDENINWSQPIIAGFFKTSLFSNFLESGVDLNTNTGLSFDFTSQDFFASYSSNLVSNKMADGLGSFNFSSNSTASNFMYDFFSGIATESAGNLLESQLQKPEVSENKSKTTKYPWSSDSNKTKTGDFLLNFKNKDNENK